MQTRDFPAVDSALMSATAFLSEELEKVKCPEKEVIQFFFCLEEIFVNIAHYAYPSGIGNVTITVDCIDDVFSVTLEDEGIRFNPLEMKAPDITLSADDRQIGGLGIYMVKETMDEVSYEYRDRKNILCMKKAIETNVLDIDA